jgi:hypothetical protein
MAESSARDRSRLLLSLMLVVATASVCAAQVPAPSVDLPPQVLSLEGLRELRGAPATRATTWEHGDIDLSFDVMLPKGSNSAVHLMGRYGLKLADSWGVRAPTFADMGGIDQRFDDARKAGFEGTAPRQNASRAPGLWQHVDVVFRAPRFEGTRKVANARFAKVTVNGVVVHENVEVTGPTKSAAFADERPTGPLVIPGDGGAVALRNIKYKSYKGSVVLSALRYRAYDGNVTDSLRAPLREGDATAITPELAGVQDNFALKYFGTMTVPTAGTYRFQLSLGWIGNDSATRGAKVGGGTLAIDGAPVLSHVGAERRVVSDVELKAGAHPFSLTFYKNRPSFNRRDVSLVVEGPGVERQVLSEESFAGGGGGPINPIVVEVRQEPVLLRGFVRHRDTKRVIAMAVADPLGVHYSYDLAQGTLLHVWRGPFLETTQMWHERGESQTAEPMGSVVTLAGAPSVAVLADANATWPDSVDDRQLQRDGYSLDKAGRPTFLYRVGGVSVEDRRVPDDSGSSLRRELTFRASSAPAGLYVQLAQADRIAVEKDGSFVVGDRGYYVTPRDGAKAVIRRVGDRDELMVPVRFDGGVGTVAYTLVW